MSRMLGRDYGFREWTGWWTEEAPQHTSAGVDGHAFDAFHHQDRIYHIGQIPPGREDEKARLPAGTKLGVEGFK